MKTLNLVAAALFVLAPVVYAGSQASPAQATSATPSTPPISEGEVRKVDRDSGSIMLRHGPLVNINMPAMTMMFHVSDPKMLNGLKEGDKVRFNVEHVNGALTVTRIEPAK